jgi:hypothetical protein
LSECRQADHDKGGRDGETSETDHERVSFKLAPNGERWPRFFEQNFRVDKWSLSRD